MAIAKLNNLEMYYEVHGTGAPLLLIAGYTCDHTFWSGMLPALAARFQVVLFDNRAVGRTRDDGKPFLIETMAADTVALLRHLELSQVALVGQSMGGAIAQTMLAQFPDMCGPCVLLNTTSLFSTRAILALENVLALRKAEVDFELVLQAVALWLFGDTWLAVPQNIKNLKNAMIKNPYPQSISDQERQLMAIKQFRMQPNKPWKHQALVISAIEDIIVSIGEGKRLAESLGAEYVEIPGGHDSPTEQPQCVAKALITFFEKSYHSR